jgi:hypothetical protein
LGSGGGVEEIREKVEGQQFTREVENTNMTDMYLQSINFIIHQ